MPPTVAALNGQLLQPFSMLLRRVGLLHRVKLTPRHFLAAEPPSACHPTSFTHISFQAKVQIRYFYKPNMPVRDPSTASNYDAWRTRHTTANLKIDFAKERLHGLLTLELESQTDKASREIILDSSHVAVSSVKINSTESKWTVKDRTEPLGSPVHIAVPEGVAKGEVVKVDIEVATTDACTALQWLTPEQTSGKKAPFMFSQCQAVHCRSLFPCQDTPDVKSTYSFRITSPHVVVASGVSNGEPEVSGDADKLYSFEQKVPIPSYLFALASGDIAHAPIGPRSYVATGPDELKACQWEFERDMEKFMEVAENLVFPYKWGQYNVLVLPPSFPYGGEWRALSCSVSLDIGQF